MLGHKVCAVSPDLFRAAASTGVQVNGRADFFDAKLVTAVYFAQNVLSQTGGLVTSIRDGHRAINSFAEAAF